MPIQLNPFEKRLFECVVWKKPLELAAGDTFGIIVMPGCTIYSIRSPGGGKLNNGLQLFEAMLEVERGSNAYVLFDSESGYELYTYYRASPGLINRIKYKIKRFELGEIGYIM